MSFSTDIFKANEKIVTFFIYGFSNGFDTRTLHKSFAASGLVSHNTGSSPDGTPSDSSRSVQLTAYFREDTAIARLPISSTARIDGKDYKVTDIDSRLVAPTPYSIAVKLSRDVV